MRNREITAWVKMHRENPISKPSKSPKGMGYSEIKSKNKHWDQFQFGEDEMNRIYGKMREEGTE